MVQSENDMRRRPDLKSCNPHKQAKGQIDFLAVPPGSGGKARQSTGVLSCRMPPPYQPRYKPKVRKMSQESGRARGKLGRQARRKSSLSQEQNTSEMKMM